MTGKRKGNQWTRRGGFKPELNGEKLSHLATYMGESGQEEFLSQPGEHALTRAEREIREYQPGAAIRLRVVKIRESG